jgi:hypothetical protein
MLSICVSDLFIGSCDYSITRVITRKSDHHERYLNDMQGIGDDTYIEQRLSQRCEGFLTHTSLFIYLVTYSAFSSRKRPRSRSSLKGQSALSSAQNES